MTLSLSNRRRALGVIVVLVAVAVGFWIGQKIPTDTATPRNVTGVVTWINTGLGSGPASGGEAEFVFRPTGSTTTVDLALPNDVAWYSAGTWSEGGIPSCLVPYKGGTEQSLGPVHAPVTLGFVHVSGSSQVDGIIVTATCLN